MLESFFVSFWILDVCCFEMNSGLKTTAYFGLAVPPVWVFSNVAGDALCRRPETTRVGGWVRGSGRLTR